MDREDYKYIPLAAIGITTGLLKYYLLPSIEDRLNAMIPNFFPSQEELDKYIGEVIIRTDQDAT